MKSLYWKPWLFLFFLAIIRISAFGGTLRMENIRLRAVIGLVLWVLVGMCFSLLLTSCVSTCRDCGVYKPLRNSATFYGEPAMGLLHLNKFFMIDIMCLLLCVIVVMLSRRLSCTIFVTVLIMMRCGRPLLLWLLFRMP